MSSKQLYALLQERGIDPAAQPVTLMRHKDQRLPLYKYIGTEALALYQAIQKYYHEPGGLIVGFYGHKPDHAILLGVWRVTGVMAIDDAYRRGLLEGTFDRAKEGWPYFLELEETGLLADLRLMLEIYWGGRPNSWRRVLKPKDNYPVWTRAEPVVPFDDIRNASLVMAELRIALQDVRWQQGLGTVAGVYLITDEHSGKQYVGSASGAGGILQRWSDYVSTGHGGNIELEELLRAIPGREHHFRLTLLEALPLLTPRAQVIAREEFWKVALGSRQFGLNRN